MQQHREEAFHSPSPLYKYAEYISEILLHIETYILACLNDVSSQIRAYPKEQAFFSAYFY